jgi:hypothetical protein
MTPSASGLVEVAVPIRDSASAADDCTANQPNNSNAGAHLWQLYKASPLGSFPPVPFKSTIKSTSSIFVGNTSGAHVGDKIPECHIRAHVRILVIECEEQITPDLVIE